MSDYYIRSWDPDSTYPANPQEGDVCYTITLDQSWAPVAGVKNDNLVKEEVYQSGNWVEVGGGGGGGDSMKRVKVTMTIDGYGGIEVQLNDDGTYPALFEFENGFTGIFGAETAGTSSATLVLFNDVPAPLAPLGNYVSSTGDCVWDAVEEVLTVTGDCTVTIEATD